MGFFYSEQLTVKSEEKVSSTLLASLHHSQCSVCPLNNQPGLRHPHMTPSGAKHPLVYILGEAPGAAEDKKGIPFIGDSGQVLRFRLPKWVLPKLRWNNCVRTRPPKNRTPEFLELECCRPSIVADIEQSKPKAIFGFGGVPLNWVLKETGITTWTGRRIPVKIGTHTCWFYPMLHPAFLIHDNKRRFVPWRQDQYPSDDEFVFAMHLKQAFAEVKHLPEPFIHSEELARADIDWVTGHRGPADLEVIKQHLAAAARETIVGFDYETNGLRPYKKDSKILTVAIATSQSTLAFPIDSPKAGWSNSERERLYALVHLFLQHAPCRKVVHSLPFEMEWSAFMFGSSVLRSGKWGCSQSQAYLLDSRIGGHSLDFLCLQYYGFSLKALSNLDRDHLEDYSLEEVLPYNGLDAKYHRLLYLTQAKLITKEKLRAVYAHQLRRIPTLVLTQIKGFPVDQGVVEGMLNKYKRRLQRLEEKLRNMDCVKKYNQFHKRPFLPTSTKQVSEMLHKVLFIHDFDKVDEENLGKLQHPFTRAILRHRSALKMISTYIQPYQKESLWPDQLIHPIISTLKVRTWRTSSEGPNAQNQPKHGEEKELRRQLRPGGNIKVVAFDYAGIQGRNVAMESKDPALVKAYRNSYDIHSDWRERLIRLYPKWVTHGLEALKDKALAKEYRQLAKNNFVFPALFGAQPPKLASGLKVPVNVAGDLLEEFWDQFAGVKGWHDHLKSFYHRTGYITGLSGFRRYAPVKMNEIINTPIQSDEAIIVLDAMNRLSEMEDERFQANLEIHDDLTFLWPAKEVDRNLEVVVREMLKITFPWINVPLGVEVNIGDNWCDLERLGEFESVGTNRFKEIK